jgi:hypothetical protein
MISSGQSRFPKLAKVVYISYPRFRGDFITQKYEESQHEKTMYATKKATWEVNPTKSREMFEEEYRKNPDAAAAKYECNPPAATNKFFRNDKLIDHAFQVLIPVNQRTRSPVDDLGFLYPDVIFDHGKPAAVHIDLALTSDRAGLCIGHMSDWSVRQTADRQTLRQPIIFVDVLTSFSANELGVKELDPGMIEDYLIECRRRGLNIKLVTSDQFQSRYMLQNIQKLGIEARLRSVDRDTAAYDLTKSAIYQGRLQAYYRERVVAELKGLKLINGVKVDHEPNGSKDEADALAGMVAGVTELAYENIESMVHGAQVGVFEGDSTWHDPMRGENPWGRVARPGMTNYR